MAHPQSLRYSSGQRIHMSVGKVTSRYVDAISLEQAAATLLICALLTISIALSGASRSLQLAAAATAGIAIALATVVGYIIWRQQ